MSAFGLVPGALVKIRRVLKSYPAVQSCWVFGSRTGRAHHPGSDIDLAICAPKLLFDDLIALRRELNDAVLYGVDVVLLDTLKNQKLKLKIQTEGRKVYPCEIQRKRC